MTKITKIKTPNYEPGEKWPTEEEKQKCRRAALSIVELPTWGKFAEGVAFWASVNERLAAIANGDEPLC